MIKRLYFDTETLGLPPKKAHWEVDYEMFPHVLSLAWKFAGGPNNYYIINQCGRAVPKEACAVNKITTKMANDPKNTHKFEDVLPLLLKDAHDATEIIGHNLYFDISMLKAHILKEYGPKHKFTKMAIEAFAKEKRYDTMRGESAKLFGKWPKLTELYEYFFKKSFNAHNAMDDVCATERCHLEMIRLKII